MGNGLCPFAIDESNITYKALKCSITKEYCGLWKFCNVENRPKMSPLYQQFGCKVENKNKNINIGGVNLKENKRTNKKNTDTNSILVKVNFTDIKNNRTAVSYTNNGNVYSIFINGIYDKKNLTIEYKNNQINEKNIVYVE